MSTLKNNSLVATSQQNSLPLMLLVEDNPIAQRMVQFFVKSLDFQLDIAGTGTEAIALFKPGKYATIWLDIGLPDFNGYEVARRIREMEKDSGFYVPIIGVSAHAPDDATLNAEAGLNAMLTKPLRAEQAKTLLIKYGVI